MAAKFGRQKGCRGEREVAALCEAWWQQLEPGCKFRRTPSSGGWGGKSDADVRAHFNACGDLMTTATQWPYCVEVKWRENWSFERFLFGGSSPVWGWWEQCKKAAEVQGHRPLLFFRNRELPWLMMADARHCLFSAMTNDTDHVRVFGSDGSQIPPWKESEGTLLVVKSAVECMQQCDPQRLVLRIGMIREKGAA